MTLKKVCKLQNVRKGRQQATQFKAREHQVQGVKLNTQFSWFSFLPNFKGIYWIFYNIRVCNLKLLNLKYNENLKHYFTGVGAEPGHMCVYCIVLSYFILLLSQTICSHHFLLCCARVDPECRCQILFMMQYHS